MKLAETVTFGGSALDRAAELRGSAQGQPQAGDQVILLWRGKILVDKAAETPLVRLRLPQPLTVGAPWVFLGQEAGQRIFAFEISSWSPNDQDLPPEGAFNDPSEQYHPELAEGLRFCELRSYMTALSPRDAELSATAKAMFHWHASHRFCARCGAASDSAQSGWQRVCPRCLASHFPRTDPVVIMLITSGQNVLLGRSPHWPEGMYSLLAGFVEPGETIEAAVRREVLEESGIRVGSVSYLASQPWAFPNSLMFGCHGEALNTDITIDPDELQDALWISKAELNDIVAGIRTDILPARAGSIAHFLLQHWLADRLD